MEIVHKEFKALNAQFHSGTAQSPHRCIGVQKHQSHITLQMYVMHFVNENTLCLLKYINQGL